MEMRTKRWQIMQKMHMIAPSFVHPDHGNTCITWGFQLCIPAEASNLDLPSPLINENGQENSIEGKNLNLAKIAFHADCIHNNMYQLMESLIKHERVIKPYISTKNSITMFHVNISDNKCYLKHHQKYMFYYTEKLSLNVQI